MRIIIVQAEIEAAIRAYIFTQIAVKEGQEITIDFKNTRGEDGATAEINIGNVPNDAPKSTQTATSSRSTAPATKIAQTTAPAVLAPAAAAGEATASETEQSADSASTTSAQQEPEAETVVEAVQKPAAAAAPANPGKSLFANLTKPVNPKPAAE